MNVVLIEDEPAAVRRLTRLLGECDQPIDILKHTDSVRGAVEWLTKHPAPELIFMDIKLADGLCFEIFERADVTAPVIFCTAYDEYAIRAFKANGIDYILKPVELSDLQESLAKYEKLKQSIGDRGSELDIAKLLNIIKDPRKEHKSRFLIKSGATYVSVAVENIAFFHTEHKTVQLVTFDEQRFFIEHTLDELETLVSPDSFFRVNRQMIIALQAVHSVENDYGRLNIHLNVPTTLKAHVSRNRTHAFKLWLDR